jgi:hypothetical protein
VLSATVATAQTPIAGAQPAPKAPAVAGDDDAGRTDLIDLIRRWRKLPPTTDTQHRGITWTIVPILSSKPATGFAAGVGADMEFKIGDPAMTRFSTLTSSFAFSTRKQVSLVENLRFYGANDRWLVEGQNFYTGTSSDNVTFGTSSTVSASDVRFYSLQFNNTFFFQLRPHLFAGAGLYFARQSQIEPFPSDTPDFETSPFREYSAVNGFDPARQTAAGPGVAVLFDNRDNQNDAIRGWYLLANYRTYIDEFLGGDSSWQRVRVEARTYHPLTRDKRHKLAFWTFGTFVTSGTAPYLSLPANGEDPLGRSSRGYPDGRFRGEQLLYGEAAYRGLVTRDGFMGIVAFVNATTIGSRSTGDDLFDSVAFAAGAGMRFLIHKQSRSNFCVDVAWGRDGSRGFYLGYRDAF